MHMHAHTCTHHNTTLTHAYSHTIYSHAHTLPYTLMHTHHIHTYHMHIRVLACTYTPYTHHMHAHTCTHSTDTLTHTHSAMLMCQDCTGSQVSSPGLSGSESAVSRGSFPPPSRSRAPAAVPSSQPPCLPAAGPAPTAAPVNKTSAGNHITAVLPSVLRPTERQKPWSLAVPVCPALQSRQRSRSMCKFNLGSR